MSRARWFALAVIVMLYRGELTAGHVDGGVYWDNLVTSQFRSVGRAKYIGGDGRPANAVLTGTHKVNDWVGFSPSIVYQTPVYSTDGHYAYILEGPAYAGHCYDTWLNITANPPGLLPTVSGSYAAEAECVTAEPIDPPDPITLCDDGSNTGNCSPILINLGTGGFKLSGPEDPADFDIDADGSRDRITWTARGSAMAFLARDRNGNGVIDDGAELFGDSTRLASGARAGNGFEAMLELDSNGDARVDSGDTAWSSLLLWVDFDHDGASQPSELQSIGTSVVEALETRHHWTGRRDRAGNFFRYKGQAQLNGTTKTIYDVYFRAVP